jgi:hypothetical protein
MPLSRETIEEFREAYEIDFGEVLSHDEARLMASEFLSFLSWIAQGFQEDLSTDNNLTELANNELMKVIDSDS